MLPEELLASGAPADFAAEPALYRRSGCDSAKHQAVNTIRSSAIARSRQLNNSKKRVYLNHHTKTRRSIPACRQSACKRMKPMASNGSELE